MNSLSKIIILALLLITQAILLNAQEDMPVYQENIGEQFYNIRRKAKLRKAAPESIYKLTFLSYKNMSSVVLRGVPLINDLRVINKMEKENYFTASQSISLWDEKYDTVRLVEDIGSSFAVTMMQDSNEIVVDTMILVNISKLNLAKYRGIATKKKYTPFAYLMRDYRNREKYIIEHDLQQEIKRKEKTSYSLNKSFHGYENITFPSDSIYVIGIEYKYINNEWYNSKLPTYGVTTSSFVIANTSDIEFIKRELSNKKKYSDKIGLTLDSVWVHKAIQKNETYYGEAPLIRLVTSSINPYDICKEIDKEVNDKKNYRVYQSLSYWTMWAASKYQPTFLTSNFTIFIESINGKIYITLEEHVPQGEVNLNFRTDLFSSDGNIINYLGKTYNSSTNDLNNKFVLDMNHFKRNEPSLNKNAYGLDSTNTIKLIAINANLCFKDKVAATIEEMNRNRKRRLARKGKIEQENRLKEQKLEQERLADEIKKETEELKVLYLKYEKKYVDAAKENKIIVGMHEDLIASPLKLWTLDSRSDFANGYSVFLISKADSNMHMHLTVRDGVVTYIGDW